MCLKLRTGFALYLIQQVLAKVYGRVPTMSEALSKPLAREQSDVEEYYRSSLVQWPGPLARDLAFMVKLVDPTVVVQMDQVRF